MCKRSLFESKSAPCSLKHGLCNDVTLHDNFEWITFFTIMQKVAKMTDFTINMKTQQLKRILIKLKVIFVPLKLNVHSLNLDL